LPPRPRVILQRSVGLLDRFQSRCHCGQIFSSHEHVHFLVSKTRVHPVPDATQARDRSVFGRGRQRHASRLPSVGMPSLRPPGPQLPRATLLPLACMRLKPHPASHGLLRAAHTRLPSALSRDAVSLALLPGSRSPDRTLIFNALLRLFLPVRRERDVVRMRRPRRS